MEENLIKDVWCMYLPDVSPGQLSVSHDVITTDNSGLSSIHNRINPWTDRGKYYFKKVTMINALQGYLHI